MVPQKIPHVVTRKLGNDLLKTLSGGNAQDSNLTRPLLKQQFTRLAGKLPARISNGRLAVTVR